jgi:hypothetical protein
VLHFLYCLGLTTILHFLTIFSHFNPPKYDIGDRIVIQPVDSTTSDDGSTHWIVRDIDLFTTTCVYAYTNEVATLNNGSIANCRILNGARSLPSLNYVYLRFGIDVTYEQIEIFREGLALYVEARPREWSKLWAVRAYRVQADQGFVEYIVILEVCDVIAQYVFICLSVYLFAFSDPLIFLSLFHFVSFFISQHVDTWQNLDGILHSRGQVRSFCHELARQVCVFTIVIVYCIH